MDTGLRIPPGRRGHLELASVWALVKAELDLLPAPGLPHGHGALRPTFELARTGVTHLELVYSLT